MTLKYFLNKYIKIIIINLIISLGIGIWIAKNEKVKYQIKCYIKVQRPIYFTMLSEKKILPQDNSEYNVNIVDYPSNIFLLVCTSKKDERTAKIGIIKWLKNIKFWMPNMVLNNKVFFVERIEPNYQKIISYALYCGILLTFIYIGLVEAFLY